MSMDNDKRNKRWKIHLKQVHEGEDEQTPRSMGSKIKELDLQKVYAHLCTLYAAGLVDSCKWNAMRIYKHQLLYS